MKKQIIENLLQNTGIEIDGTNPWDIQVKNSGFYDRVLQDHSLGLGESYMDGWWECEELDEVFHKLLLVDIEQLVQEKFTKDKEFFLMGLKLLFRKLPHFILNFQRKSKAFEVGEEHYNIGNDLFSAMLDPEMNYTCGYWKDQDNLADAQAAKCKLICDKLNLQPNQRILDIGCGWGSFARYAAKNYGVEVVGVTISKEQKELADELNKGLPITIELKDYRDITEQYDHVVSIGMFEHVGYKNYKTYMEVAANALKDDGLFLLHTIGSNTTSHFTNDWVQKYIFPNGMLPSIAQIGKAVENHFVVEDLHNFGADYDKTLMAWHQQFNEAWGKLEGNYSNRFYRMWNYYLLSCAGSFRARYIQLWQWVLSKNGVINGYQSLR